ncbi:uncharacterized protein BO88DRAFT_5036 [Aspergillus vadensis CBS 113365]|uniref:Uncharacterized protein n=1 Tax=Aspergillus vadensis (strain CBS 113365 / IMI 142717 / IBT 24658) TaxID=1448311 RepID=A0A319BP93_ASPVC|nr:hypothetical protein BO88DRAFT_5036 [Aspergillus vadensis CBS 113365]PYH74201.1 hypothetical protein BO88DRAFT_5036 [Aspergillus vadensis CBS 113365]
MVGWVLVSLILSYYGLACERYRAGGESAEMWLFLGHGVVMLFLCIIIFRCSEALDIYLHLHVVCISYGRHSVGYLNWKRSYWKR